jgi:hypothetical protein
MMLEKYWLPRALRPLISKGAAAGNRLAAFCLDGIVTADPWVAADFQKVAREKTIVYYNFPVPSLFAANGKRVTATADLVYVGGMSERSGIFVLLDALALLAAKNCRPSVRLAGYTDGLAGRSAIECAIADRGLGGQSTSRSHPIQKFQLDSERRVGWSCCSLFQVQKNIHQRCSNTHVACRLSRAICRPSGASIDGENGLCFTTSRKSCLHSS